MAAGIVGQREAAEVIVKAAVCADEARYVGVLGVNPGMRLGYPTDIDGCRAVEAVADGDLVVIDTLELG